MFSRLGDDAVTTVTVVDLDEPAAVDARRVGSKAAALAQLRTLDQPILPGFVVTVEATAGIRTSADAAAVPDVRDAWRRLSGAGSDAVVVRSSSPVEDTASSSMAGRFHSEIDVRGWQAFCDAVARVAGSACLPGSPRAPMAVLVQRHLEASTGGVLFGLDPLTGRRDHLALAVVAGGPHLLVGGLESGTRLVLSRRGRLLEAEGDQRPPWRMRRRLARVARRLEAAFGGPQDIEWAVGPDGTLWVLQSRPVTAAAEVADGPLLGQGPLAETLPDPLPRIVQDLLVPPLRTAVCTALRSAGRGGRALERSPVVTVVHDTVVCDLVLVGAMPAPRSLWSTLDLRPAARRLRAAWRLGRLRLDAPVAALVAARRTDRDLAAIPPLRELTDDALIELVHEWQPRLTDLHRDEMIAGFLARGEPTRTAAAAALSELHAHRAAGLEDRDIRATAPAVLTLSAPALGDHRPLPPIADAPGGDRRPDGADALATAREVLRLRVRMVHELLTRVAGELTQRVASGWETQPDAAAAIGLEATIRVLRDSARPPGPDAAPADSPRPLPAAFRLTPGGDVVAVTEPSDGGGDGIPVAPGYGRGRVHVGADAPHPGDVLVVRHLDPSLAPLLPTIGGIVAERGSALSHLAILAREYGVPVIVDVPDAVRRFADAGELTVDGSTGVVIALDDAPS